MKHRNYFYELVDARRMGLEQVRLQNIIRRQRKNSE